MGIQTSSNGSHTCTNFTCSIMRKSILTLLLGLILCSEISIKNIEEIDLKGGFLFKPRFNSDGTMLSVEKWGGGSNEIFIIDLDDLENYMSVRKKLSSKKKLIAKNILWSYASNSDAYFEAVSLGKRQLYKINARNMLDEQKNYLENKSKEIFEGTKVAFHNISIGDFGGNDILFLSYFDKKEMKNNFVSYSSGSVESILDNVSQPINQMCSYSEAGYVALQMNSDNVDQMLLSEEYEDFGSPRVLDMSSDSIFVYEPKFNRFSDDDLYLSFLGKKFDNKKEKFASLYIVKDPFESSEKVRAVDNISIRDESMDLMGSTYDWHPDASIIFYIKKDLSDRKALHYYSLDDNKEYRIEIDVKEIQNVSVSSDGSKIAFCSSAKSVVYIGDLVVE